MLLESRFHVLLSPWHSLLFWVLSLMHLRYPCLVRLCWTLQILILQKQFYFWFLLQILLCDANCEVSEWIHSFKFLNFDVNSLLPMRIFHCPLCIFFPVLFDHQSMGSFVFRSASYGSFSSNQIDTIYKVEITDLLPLAENFVLPEFSSTLNLLHSRRIWTEMPPGEIFRSILVKIIYLVCTLWRLYFSEAFKF